MPAIGHDATFPKLAPIDIKVESPVYLTESQIGAIFRRSQNNRQFAVNLARTLFSPHEMRMSNCRGVRNYLPLDEQKLEFIRCTVRCFYVVEHNMESEAWKLCMQSIDSHCRHERRLLRKTLVKDF